MSDPLKTQLDRREFIRQTFAFSALAALAPGSTLVKHGGNDSPPPNPASEHILMIGDWGTATDVKQQISVAEGMKKFVDSQHVHPEALLLLGDNWYGPIAGAVDSSRWRTQFEEMYPASYFPGPVYAVLGNHDYEFRISRSRPYNKVQMQLDYASHVKGTRWKMPSRWYTFMYPEHNPMITFICLDTNIPGSKSGDPYPWRDTLPFSYTMSDDHQKEQDAWFRAELAKPRKTPFLAVAAHHPLYSNGGHRDNPTLINNWDRLLRQYKVDFYIAGHDHDLQHLEFAGHPTSFVVSGGGGAELTDMVVRTETRGPFGNSMLGFTDMEITPGEIIMRHFNHDAQELHAFRKPPGGVAEILKPLAS
jgi:tartrate-resistant acid phosphatase type 5